MLAGMGGVEAAGVVAAAAAAAAAAAVAVVVSVVVVSVRRRRPSSRAGAEAGGLSDWGRASAKVTWMGSKVESPGWIETGLAHVALTAT